MRRIFSAFLGIAAIISMQASIQAQIGYSITDNDRDATSLDQQMYRFDLSTGQGTLVGPLTVNGQQIAREYEGLASIGGVLYGVAEYDDVDCNTSSDPITGLASDLRIFRVTDVTYPLANGLENFVGPQVGETCFISGFTESAAAYNPTDGWIYAIASDDGLPASAPRSRLYRISPTTGLSSQVGTGDAAAGIILTDDSLGGDQNPYLDGLAILPDGRIYASENRFNNAAGNANGAIYQLFATGPNAGRARFITNTLTFDANRDTGLANAGNVLYLLLEDARVYSISDLTPSLPGTARAVALDFGGGSNTLTTPGCLRTTIPGQTFCGDFEGFDIPEVPLR